MTMKQIADEVWRFTARHPAWHPKGFGDEVAGFALRDGDELALVDPLVQDAADLAQLDALVAGAVTIFVTIPYHVRSAARLARRWSRVEVLGHSAVARRLPRGAPFRAIAAGEPLPHDVEAFAIGSPRRQELPLHFPRARAIAFGDAVVGAEGGLRVWGQGRRSERWYRDRFRPTLDPLAELEPERVLVTHGPPVLHGGAGALREALDVGPWDPPRG
jgi:glyoxylase-like metal-dependent hydrolase (beta-lactamase superfamily II)